MDEDSRFILWIIGGFVAAVILITVAVSGACWLAQNDMDARMEACMGRGRTAYECMLIHNRPTSLGHTPQRDAR